MDYHHHARLTIHRQRELAAAVLLCRLSFAGGRGRVQTQPAERGQMGATLPCRGRGRACAIAVRVLSARRGARRPSRSGKMNDCGGSAGPECASPRPPD